MIDWLFSFTVVVLIADRVELARRISHPPTRGFWVVTIVASGLMFIYILSVFSQLGR